MSGQDDKISCPSCGANWHWVEFEGLVYKPIIDETTNKMREVTFAKHKCNLCKHTWLERIW